MARTLNEAFDELIKRLQPLETEHGKGIKHKATVQSCLEKNFKCYKMFETGSFGNVTGIRHYSDTDYFAVCEAKELPDSSAYTLEKFRDALKYTFHSTDGIRVNTPAVKIPFGIYASETLEITPTYFHGLIDTSLGKKAYYSIPNFNDGWMRSSPDAHNSYVQKQDERLNGKLKPLIQLVKAWKYYNDVPILSFYSELRVTKYAEGESAIVYDIDLRNVLRLLNDNQLASMQDPMDISGYVRPCKTDAQKETALSKLNTAFTRADKAVGAREDKVEEAFRFWDLVFDGKFPAR